MRLPSSLPDDLPPTFAIADAAERGLPAGRLRRSDLEVPYPGVRRRLGGASPSSVRDLCQIYAPRLKNWQFFSHETALVLIGAPSPEWPYLPSIHVSAHRPAREPRLTNVAGHRLQLREAATLVDAAGLPIEHPVRAWRQCGLLWQLDDLVAAADYLVSGETPCASAEDLAHEVAVMGDVRGAVLRRALSLVRPGVRSSRETRLRLVLGRAGLPEPQINWVLRTAEGGFVAELDLAYPRYRVGAEYDGRVHAEDPAQFAKDADRWDRIRAEGWDHVRVLNHHMRGGGAAAVAKVRDALQRGGWHPRRT
ncbi:MAG: hypothetical protein NT132_04655 [Microbacterium sp.]|uniref:hypothetical protein n=1 Tax=Microbacterium sp. TaxID=51671 RepID=UPI0026062EC5|nr:hypothetical protein [Microbacterium sp.]MCX6501688.1 hypothetical protein [Microbacterium sp.]